MSTEPDEQTEPASPVEPRPEGDASPGGDSAPDDDPSSDDDAWTSSRNPEVEPKLPWFSVLVAVVAVALGMTVALQQGFRGSAVPWFVMGGVYLGLAALAAVDLHRRGLLGQRFRIRPGDTSIGIVVGLVLCAGGALAQRMLAVEGSQGAIWLGDVHRFGGNFQTNGLLIFVLFVICVCEETVWRGMVQDQLAAWRPRSAPALTAVAYAASTSPSLLLLSEGTAPNPLLVLAALGTGVVWSYARRAVPRLFPLIVSHLVFTYFMAAPLPSWIVPS